MIRTATVCMGDKIWEFNSKEHILPDNPFSDHVVRSRKEITLEGENVPAETWYFPSYACVWHFSYEDIVFDENKGKLTRKNTK